MINHHSDCYVLQRQNYFETPFQKFLTFGKVKPIDNQSITRKETPQYFVQYLLNSLKNDSPHL
jgi:hypothetical protein